MTSEATCYSLISNLRKQLHFGEKKSAQPFQPKSLPWWPDRQLPFFKSFPPPRETVSANHPAAHAFYVAFFFFFFRWPMRKKGRVEAGEFLGPFRDRCGPCWRGDWSGWAGSGRAKNGGTVAGLPDQAVGGGGVNVSGRVGRGWQQQRRRRRRLGLAGPNGAGEYRGQHCAAQGARGWEPGLGWGKVWAWPGKEPRAFSGLNQGWSFLAQRPLLLSGHRGPYAMHGLFDARGSRRSCALAGRLAGR